MKKGLVRRQSGFVLISLAVFLFLAALVALGDMRTLAVQQTVVTTMYAAQNAMAETESALATMEQFAAYEGSELGKTGGNARLTTLTNPSTTDCTNGSEPSSPASRRCIKRRCASFLYPKLSVAGAGKDNMTGQRLATLKRLRDRDSEADCSFCPPPTPACKARWLETPGANNSPWAEFPVNFYTIDTEAYALPTPRSASYRTKKFYGMVEYLGWAQCNVDDAMNPSATNLDAYDGFMAMETSMEKTRGCRLMRVTVRNQPPTVSQPTITLQSTLLVASVLNYPAGVYNEDNKDTPPCCLRVPSSGTTPRPINPASFIWKEQGTNPSDFRVAIDAERISWRQIFSGAE